MNTAHTVDDAEKRAAMEEVLQSATFVRASQVRNFLRYICEMELAGRAAALHEYLIAVEAMGLPSSYSTDDDSSVRRRARNFRMPLSDSSCPLRNELWVQACVRIAARIAQT